MIELFTDIPNYTKQQSEFWVKLALQQKNAMDGINMLKEYRKSCLNDREREFFDFYVNLKLEELKSNENSND